MGLTFRYWHVDCADMTPLLSLFATTPSLPDNSDDMASKPCTFTPPSDNDDASLLPLRHF